MTTESTLLYFYSPENTLLYYHPIIQTFENTVLYFQSPENTLLYYHPKIQTVENWYCRLSPENTNCRTVVFLNTIFVEKYKFCINNTKFVLMIKLYDYQVGLIHFGLKKCKIFQIEFKVKYKFEVFLINHGLLRDSRGAVS